MLGSLTRIITDRSVGQLFFGNYRLMDYELMGGDARDAIIAKAGKRNCSPSCRPWCRLARTNGLRWSRPASAPHPSRTCARL